MKAKRVAIYTRVSTDSQTTDNQLLELEAAAKRHKWEIVAIYRDEGVTGSKPLYKRAEGKKLQRAIARREIDLVAAWSVDRLGRSLQDLLGTLSELEAKGIDLYLHQQGVDTTTPGGKALFQMLGVFAEFERAMIRERINAGLARAKAAGKILGRPRVSDETVERIVQLRAQGRGIRKIAAELRTGVGTVTRVLSATG
jgi:DNA invertase Pin-like site-specific DNA recombinase